MRLRSVPVVRVALVGAVTATTLLALLPGSGEPVRAAAPVVDPAVPAAVATNGGYTIVVQPSGRALAAGGNSRGGLADGTTTSRTTPAEVRDARDPLTDVVQAAVGRRHTLLLRAGGTVLAAGDDVGGQLGRGTTTGATSANPVPLPVVSPTGKGALARIVQVAATDEASFALAADGTVHSWGSAAEGALGRPGKGAVAIPGPVVLRGGKPLGGIARISCTGEHCLALASSGRLYSWGDVSGSLLGPTPGAANPVTGPGTSSRLVEPVTVIGTTQRQSYAVGGDGALHGWGENLGGILGVADNALSYVSRPAPVVTDEGSPVQGVVQVAGGDGQTIAVTRSGGVLAWGSSVDDRIGPIPGGGTVQRHPASLTLPGGASAVAVAASRSTTLVQTAGGGLVAVGRSATGALLLGDATTASTPTASAVTGIGLPRLRLVDEPWVAGNGTLGATLSVANLRVSPFPTVTTYQWYRSGSRIRGATGARYTVTEADVTKKLQARITVSRAGYGSATARTDERSIERPPIRVVTSPTIGGRTRVGATLTASAGTYRPAPTSATYIWTRDGVRISGATARTYRVARADRGHLIRVSVTVSRNPYLPKTTTSAAVRIR